MKKLISLIAMGMITAVAFAQDTIPGTLRKNNQGSNRLDTMPRANQMSKDSLSLNRGNKWPDTSMNRNWPDTSLGNSGKMPDSLNTSSNWNNTSRENSVDTSMMSNNKWQDTLSGKTGNLNSNSMNTTKDSAYNSGMKKDNMQGSRDTGFASMADRGSDNLSTDSSSLSKMMTDKVIMKDNQVMVVKNGDSTLLEENITLKSGAIVMKDGTVKYSNGTTTTLKNGQYININAKEGKKPKKNKQKVKSAE